MLGRGVAHCHHGSSYKALLRLHFICGCLSYDDHDGDVMLLQPGIPGHSAGQESCQAWGTGLRPIPWGNTCTCA